MVIVFTIDLLIINIILWIEKRKPNMVLFNQMENWFLVLTIITKIPLLISWSFQVRNRHFFYFLHDWRKFTVFYGKRETKQWVYFYNIKMTSFVRRRINNFKMKCDLTFLLVVLRLVEFVFFLCNQSFVKNEEWKIWRDQFLL